MASQLLQRVMQMPLIPAQMQQPRPLMPAAQRPGSALLRIVRADPHGDTILAQINPQEAAILKARGTSHTGDINPRTGIRDFDPHSTGNNPGGAGNTGSSNNGGNGGGGGRADRDQQGYSGGTSSSNNPGGNQVGGGNSGGTGLRGPTDSTGQYAGFTNANGPAGIDTGQSDPTKLGGVGSNYQGGIADYVDNYKNDVASRVVNFLTGVGLQQPDPNQPSTWANGLAHTGFNPVQEAVSLAGLMAPPGVGALASKAAGAAYTAFGGRPVVVGNASPQPGGTQTYDGTGGPSVSRPQPATSGNPYGGQGQPTIFQGGAVAAPPIPGMPGAPVASGSQLPPIAAPTLNAVPGGNFQVPGPYQYSYTLPPWTYQGRPA